MVTCNHVREYQKAEQRLLFRQKVVYRAGLSGCNHVREFNELEKAVLNNGIQWREYPLCRHGVEGYCKECLSELSETERGNKTLKAVNVMYYPQKAVENIIKKPKVIHELGKNYRLNLRGNKGFTVLNGDTEVEKFKKLRLQVNRKIKNRCFEYGIRYDRGLLEDCLQDTLLDYYEHLEEYKKTETESWHYNRNIYRIAWKMYARQAKWLNHNSINQTLDSLLESDQKADRAFYSVHYKEIREDNREFYRACKEQLTAKQYRIALGLIEGLKPHQIQGKYKIKPRTYTYNKEVIKTALSCGVIEYAR